MSSSAWSFGTESDTAVREWRRLELAKVAHQIVTVNTWVQPGENVVILTDPEFSPLIVEALAVQVYVAGGIPLVFMMPGQTVHGAEVPAPAAAALKAADVIYGAVSRSISHLVSMQEARANGARYIGFSNLTEDAFLHGAATADPTVVKEIGDKVRAKLLDCEKVRVTSKLGTDVTFSLKGRYLGVTNGVIPRNPVHDSSEPLPDNARMFPDGEMYCCPLEDSVEGKIVVDRWIQGVGILSSPVTWTFKGGRCVEITGGIEAQRLTNLLDTEGDENSRNMGEFAVGINPNARFDGNPHREGKKLLGGVHFALGTGKVTGGVLQSTLHLDGTLTPPVIYANDEIIFDEGTLRA